VLENFPVNFHKISRDKIEADCSTNCISRYCTFGFWEWFRTKLSVF